MGSKYLFPVAAAVCLAQMPISSAWAANKYSARDITPPGAVMCRANGVNASGQVVGDYFLDTAYQVVRGFVTGPNGRRPILIGTLGGDKSGLSDINDDGLAVGYATTVNNLSQSAIMVPAGSNAPVDVGVAGWTTASASYINNKGWILGSGLLPDQSWRSFFIAPGAGMTTLEPYTTPGEITEDGVIVGGTQSAPFMTGPKGTGMTALGSLGGSAGWASGINKKKEVVGFSQTPNGISYHAFVTDPGGLNMRDVGVPGDFAMAKRINSKGTIVGIYLSTWADPQRAFVADRLGKYSDLSTLTNLGPTRYLSDASALNDDGQIVATSNDWRCFLLTPVDR